MEKLIAAKNVNSYITDYIKLADTKIGAYITISTAISAALIPTIQKLLLTPNLGYYLTVLIILYSISVLAFIATLICSLNALSPKTTPAKSLVSFPDINKLTQDEYLNSYAALTETDLINEYLKHNKTLSEIAINKFKWLGRATNFCYVWILIYILLYVTQFFIINFSILLE